MLPLLSNAMLCSTKKKTGACSQPRLQGEEAWGFNPDQIDLLIQIWGHVSRLDGTISHSQLVKLLRSILPPLGVGPEATPQQADEYITQLGIAKVLDNRYTFEHTSFALIASVAGSKSTIRIATIDEEHQRVNVIVCRSASSIK